MPRRREIGRLPIRGVSRRSASVSGGVEVTLRQTKMLPPPRLPPPATRAPAARAGLAAATKLQPLRKRPCHTAQWPRALARTHRRLPFSLEGRLPSISCPWCADTRFVPCSLLRDRFCAFSAGGRFSRASSQEAFFLDQFCAPLALFLFFFSTCSFLNPRFEEENGKIIASGVVAADSPFSCHGEDAPTRFTGLSRCLERPGNGAPAGTDKKCKSIAANSTSRKLIAQWCYLIPLF